MKLPYGAGAVASLFVFLVGMFLMWKLQLFRTEVGFCILALLFGLSLNFLLISMSLRERIDALEKRLEQKP